MMDSGNSLVSSPESEAWLAVGLVARPNPPPSSLGLDFAGLQEDGVGGGDEDAPSDAPCAEPVPCGEACGEVRAPQEVRCAE